MKENKTLFFCLAKKIPWHAFIHWNLLMLVCVMCMLCADVTQRMDSWICGRWWSWGSVQEKYKGIWVSGGGQCHRHAGCQLFGGISKTSKLKIQHISICWLLVEGFKYCLTYLWLSAVPVAQGEKIPERHGQFIMVLEAQFTHCQRGIVYQMGWILWATKDWGQMIPFSCIQQCVMGNRVDRNHAVWVVCMMELPYCWFILSDCSHLDGYLWGLRCLLLKTLYVYKYIQRTR